MTTEPLARRRQYLLGKARPNAIVGRNRDNGELLLLLIGGGLGLLSGLLLPWRTAQAILLFTFPALAFAIVFVPYRRRTFYKWFEINRSYRRLLRGGQARWRSGAMEAGVRIDGTEVEIGPPPGVGRIRWLSTPFGLGELAVLMHLDRRTATATIEIEGPGVGLRDAEDQEALVARFGNLLQHVANGDGYVRRLQMMARTVPSDPYAHTKDVANRGATNAPELLRQSYDTLQRMVSTTSEMHRAYLTACVPYTRELATEAHLLGGGDEGLAAVVAREIGDIVARLLDADIRVRRPLGINRMASLIHSMYDPDHPIDRTEAMTRRTAWPAELDARHQHYLQSKTRESDTAEPWCHASAWIKEWPVTPVGVNFLAPLLVHTPDVIRTVAVTMELEPTDVAINRMLSEKTNVEAEEARAAKLGRVADPRDSAHTSRVDQRGDDLAAGAAGVNLVGYVTVSARDPELLSRDKRTIRASAGKSYLKLEWCDREHHRAFVNTLPFATGIKH
ncbi:MAG: hypothetical protein L0Y54_15460 [Sporichthyaceae bacterium]|nr:hypothetical protein [Sporichthyaceae bacterium]